MRLILALLLTLTLPLTAPAQDRAGRNTPGEWVVTQYTPHGLWDMICDQRDAEQRCYLRYVEVFSPRPNFAAQFIFVTAEAGGYRVEFGVEAGTSFNPGGFRIEQNGAVLWSNRRPTCLRGADCFYAGGDADFLLSDMIAGDAFVFDFTDRHGTPRVLRWDLTRFGAAFNEFQSELAARGLGG